LKSIEAQHGLLVEQAKGIYSFSHLTFNEYFAARQIISVKQSSDEALQSLVRHINNKNWREVFLLAVEMSPDAERLLLLMKRRVDELLCTDKKLQILLSWMNKKADQVEVPYEPVTVRAFYLERVIDLKLAVYYAPDNAKTKDFGVDAALNIALIRTLNTDLYLDNPLFDEYNGFGSGLDLALDAKLKNDLTNLSKINNKHKIFKERFSYLNNIHQPLENALRHQIQIELKLALQELKNKLPEQDIDEEKFKQWWQNERQEWNANLRKVMINYRNIGYDWQFSKQQWKLIADYYNTNKLLVECLARECYVDHKVRQRLRNELLLPV
jgi:predicted NACHT family NTPase